MGVFFFYSVQGVGGAATGGGYRGGGPYKKIGVHIFFYSPPQELEVGARRALYLLVKYIITVRFFLSYYYYSYYYYTSVKNFSANSHSSRTQTAEPIVNCHTIL